MNRLYESFCDKIRLKKGSARIPTYLDIDWLRQNFRFCICLGHLKAYTKLLEKLNLHHSDWSIRKWHGPRFFKFSTKVLKIGFFNFDRILRFSPLSFEARKVSNDRESFSLESDLFLIIFESCLLWEQNPIWKKWGCSGGHQFPVWCVNVLLKKNTSAWIFDML